MSQSIAYHGPMGGGKTKHLLTHYKPGYFCLIPRHDNRSGGCIKSHDGFSIGAHAVTHIPTVYRPVPAWTIIDEAHMFNHEELRDFIDALHGGGGCVAIAGISFSAISNQILPWFHMVQNMGITVKFCAESKCEVHSCPGRATQSVPRHEFPMRPEPSDYVGGFEKYTSVCCAHSLLWYHSRREISEFEFQQLPESWECLWSGRLFTSVYQLTKYVMASAQYPRIIIHNDTGVNEYTPIGRSLRDIRTGSVLSDILS